MSKPASGSSPLRWATVPLIPADVTAPDTTHMDEGWQDAEEPPHSFLNYWMKLVYLWVVYLDNLTAEALTWTAVETFNLGIVVTYPNATQPAVKATGGSDGMGGFGLAFSAPHGGLTLTDGVINATGNAVPHSFGPLHTTTAVVTGYLQADSLLVATTSTFTGAAEFDASVVADANVTLSAGDLTLTAGKIVADNNLVPHVLGSTQIDGDLQVNVNTSLAGTLTATGAISANGGIVTQASSNLTLLNSWLSFAAPVRHLRSWQDPMGLTHLEGQAEKSLAGPVVSVIATLPAGQRPVGTGPAATISFMTHTRAGRVLELIINCDSYNGGGAGAGDISISATETFGAENLQVFFQSIPPFR